ncbi:alpha/beta hydrolase family protein [Xanthovirga aplysinae]|uniref:alpha/beta hydrolase family protein n=1 Tax=Xanthovirga aplysinae TaxID=2529853 RepID=UPI00165693A2|nr:acyl-CoA thioester hydrolase/BAAT C-terminal domain-containing protein [Xanthovirga aplysinae]
MKKRFIALFITGILTGNLWAQLKTPKEFGFQAFSLEDSMLGTINFYVSKNKIEESKPLLVLLDGSGHLPIYSKVKKSDGTSFIFSSNPFRYKAISEKYHVVLISKPGVPFLDSLKAESQQEFKRNYPPSKAYTKHLSLDWRVNTTSKIIDYLTQELVVKDNEVIAIGYSEGGHVVPKLALINKKVKKIVNIVGGGLNQFNDFITENRLKGQKGLISAVEAQQNVDSLYAVFDDIYKNPLSTDNFWLGHTYKRWASFCKDIPLENMLSLDIPILLISGGQDQNTPIAGLDYVKLEFLRNNKTNLTYKVYPNCDHWFNDQKMNSNRLLEMIDFVFDWIGSSREV